MLHDIDDGTGIPAEPRARGGKEDTHRYRGDDVGERAEAFSNSKEDLSRVVSNPITCRYARRAYAEELAPVKED